MKVLNLICWITVVLCTLYSALGYYSHAPYSDWTWAILTAVGAFIAAAITSAQDQINEEK